jgi:hypothetical protein
VAVAFIVASLIFLWPLVSEVVVAVRRRREGKSGHWEGYLAIFFAPFAVGVSAFARDGSWVPSPIRTVAGCLVLTVVDGLICLAITRRGSERTVDQ